MREIVKQKQSISERISSGIDGLISIVSPQRALKRQMFRAASKFAAGRGGYSGASKTRLRASWLPGGGSADEDLLGDLPDLRERSRDLARNDGIAAGVVTTMKSNVIGTGISPQSRVDKNSLGIDEAAAMKFQRQAERAWNRWKKTADAGGRMSFWEIQHLIMGQLLLNGEVLIVREMIDEPHRSYFTALNVVEADRLGTPSDKATDKNIRDGVELGTRGEPIAYWIRKTHPGDTKYGLRNAAATEYTRYPARNQYGQINVFHLYWVKRPGQTRGEPFFSPVLNRFKDLADGMEAELVAQRVAACFAMFIETPEAYVGATNRATSTVNGQRREELEPGIIERLAPGEKPYSYNPNRPGTTFDPFIEKVLRFIGTGLGLPYELILKDFSKTNYSSARAALLEARKMFRTEQKWLAEKFCQPVYELVIDESFLRGDIEAEGYFDRDRHDDFVLAKWIYPGWGYIDPAKEIDAARSAIAGGLSTLGDECGALGRDWEETQEQAAREQNKRRQLGLPDLDDQKAAAGNTIKPQENDPKPGNDETIPPEDDPNQEEISDEEIE